MHFSDAVILKNVLEHPFLFKLLSVLKYTFLRPAVETLYPSR